MKTILRRILFPLALFVSINVSGENRFSTGYQSDYHYNTYYDHSVNSGYKAEEYEYQNPYHAGDSWFTPFSADGMGGFPGDPGSGNGGGMGGFPGDPGNNGGGMGDFPGDPGHNLPITDDWYAFLILGLCYGCFVYIRRKDKQSLFYQPPLYASFCS